MATTYSLVAVTAPGKLETLNAELPTPGKEEVLLKVEYSSLTPFDGYQAEQGFLIQDYPQVLGINATGTVAQMGPGIEDLKIGDRVTAFSYFPKAKGFQEYVVLPRSVIAKISDSLSLPEATTIPDSFITAFYTLFNQLELPLPSTPPAKQPPVDQSLKFLVYGASTASGQYTLQLLRLAGYKNVIAVASPMHRDYLVSSGAASVLDYKSADLVDQIRNAVGGDGKVDFVVDCVAVNESLAAISKVVRPGGSVAWLTPIKHGGDMLGNSANLLFYLPEDISAQFPESVKLLAVRTFFYQKDECLANTLMPTTLPKLLEAQLIKPLRLHLVDQGTSLLERTKEALGLIRDNKIRGVKLVVKIPN